MKAYIQYADGSEIELKVDEPDPPDGTFTAFVPEGVSVVLSHEGSWLRIVPD